MVSVLNSRLNTAIVAPRALKCPLFQNRAGVVDRNSPFLASTIVRTDVAQRLAPLWKEATLAAFKLLAASDIP